MNAVNYQELYEAFVNKKFAPGELKFSQSKLAETLDPKHHFANVIALAAQDMGKTPQELYEEIEKKVKEYDDLANIAPTLYQTMKHNTVEGEVFKLMKKIDRTKHKAPTYQFHLLNDLWNYVQVEHHQFFPLRNMFDHKYQINAQLITVPSSKSLWKKYNDIGTACATPEGHFVFNTVFLQQLLDYAFFKGLKAKGKKYKSNGGKFPDEWEYVEFVIIHELMHYSYGDFEYHKQFKAEGMKVNPKIINWVGDFRTNYLLVKSGFNQLPIGLFNDGINYDRQKTYREMYDIVKDEFDKLTAAQKAKVQKNLGQHEDDHPVGGKDKPAPDWKPEVGDPVVLPTGEYGKIIKIGADGKIEVEKLKREEAIEVFKEKYGKEM